MMVANISRRTFKTSRILFSFRRNNSHSVCLKSVQMFVVCVAWVYMVVASIYKYSMNQTTWISRLLFTDDLNGRKKVKRLKVPFYHMMSTSDLMMHRKSLAVLEITQLLRIQHLDSNQTALVLLYDCWTRILFHAFIVVLYDFCSLLFVLGRFVSALWSINIASL